jgi:hypothetical protein
MSILVQHRFYLQTASLSLDAKVGAVQRRLLGDLAMFRRHHSDLGTDVRTERQHRVDVGTDSGNFPSPALVLWEMGLVIATCLGISLAMNLLLRALSVS